MKVAVITAALALAGLAAPCSAYNALKNGDFTGGTGPWNLAQTGGGSAGWESFLGSPAGGSLRLQSFDFFDTTHADQCADVRRWSVLDFDLRQIDNLGTSSGKHTFELDLFDAADCTGNTVGTITPPQTGTALGDGWSEVSVLGTSLPSNAVSARVNLDVVAEASTVAYFLVDTVEVIPPDEIFPDDFEGG